MSAEQRIRLCLLIEKLYEQKDYSQKIGLEDRSKFHGKRISREEERKTC